MSLQSSSNLKVDVASSSTKTLSTYRDSAPYDHYGSSTAIASRKGRLFVIADSKTRRPEPGDAGKLAIDIIQENYFTYPSSDIAFCLQRAMDTANRRVYQYAQTNALHKKIGATCSALVITDRHAYVAHVGDCRIYRVSVRKVEQLTQEHTRVLDMLPREVGTRDGTRAVLTRALGIKLGVKIETINKIPVQRDEYFVMTTSAIDVIPEHEIQSIVLSHTPQTASRKLQEMAIERGADGNVAVQVIKIYNEYRRRGKSRASTGDNAVAAEKSNWRMKVSLTFMLGAVLFVLMTIISDELPQIAEATIGRYSVSLDEAGFLSKTIEQRMEDAEGYLKNGNLHDAAAIYQKVLEAESTEIKAVEGLQEIMNIYITRGDSMLALKNLKAAEEDYRLAYEIDPNSSMLSEKLADVRAEIEKSRAVARLASNKLRQKKRKQKFKPEPVAPRPEQILPTFLSLRNWKTPGLYRGDDFHLVENSMVFENNIRIKKAFGIDAYGNVEILVNARRTGGLGNGKYGIIFGHNISDPFQSFYLFTIDKDSQYALERISRNSINKITNGSVPVGVKQSNSPTQLKIKCIDKTILLYANGELLTMVTDKTVRGGIGLYADPNMQVEFSGLSAEPVSANLAEQ